MILFAKSQTASRAYRVGLGLAALTAFVTVWTTIVRDDGQGAASFMVILAAAVGAFADPNFPMPEQAVWCEDRHAWLDLPPAIAAHARNPVKRA